MSGRRYIYSEISDRDRKGGVKELVAWRLRPLYSEQKVMGIISWILCVWFFLSPPKTQWLLRLYIELACQMKVMMPEVKLVVLRYRLVSGESCIKEEAKRRNDNKKNENI